MSTIVSVFRRSRAAGLALLLALALLSLTRRDSSANARFERQSSAALAVANDDRSTAGSMTNRILTVVLNARPARWLPDDGVDTALVVVPAGQPRVVEFAVGAPGTYLYWASTTGRSPVDRTGGDAQLTGALITDPAGVPADTSERVFVITMMEVYADSTKLQEPRNNIFYLAVNGKSWPHTKRLTYSAGDTVRWRWVNGGQLDDPMHLHGFHFRVLARGNGSVDMR